MRDTLAFFVIFFVLIIFLIAYSDDKPQTKFEKLVCANITCYSEIKDK